MKTCEYIKYKVKKRQGNKYGKRGVNFQKLIVVKTSQVSAKIY